jgi:protein involved in polysaccharide export with SLBB domain
MPGKNVFLRLPNPSSVGALEGLERRHGKGRKGRVGGLPVVSRGARFRGAGAWGRGKASPRHPGSFSSKGATCIFRRHYCAALLSLRGAGLLLFLCGLLCCRPQAMAAPQTNEPRLAASDLVEVRVFQEPELDTVARLTGDGKVTLPLLGEVHIAGRTCAEASRIVAQRLGERFLVHPEVSIQIRERTRRLFTILGQVQRPGTYRFPEGGDLDLLQALGMAGGFTRLAAPSRVSVRRFGAGEAVEKVDTTRLLERLRQKSVTIRPGDVITVGERIF